MPPKAKTKSALVADAVFEGGGVKGSALVGAVTVAESLGYSFCNLAGTSAGAIIAAFLAAGYTGLEIKAIMEELDYRRLKDPDALDRIPVVGVALSVLFTEGIYKGDYIENFVREKLAARGVRAFGDLVLDEYKNEPKYRYKLQVIASDITLGRLLVLPRDLAGYCLDPDRLEVAAAVRMSMSIPYFYQPVILSHKKSGRSYIVDGGILSNYPVWLFDEDAATDAWPTLGFKLVDPAEGKPKAISGPISMLAALFATMMEAHDARYIKDADFMRSIPIPTLGVQTTDFDLSPQKKEALFMAGAAAAQKFFDQWDFAKYQKTLRQSPAHRTERIWKRRAAK